MRLIDDIEIKLITNGPDGLGTYSALCPLLNTVRDPLKRDLVCMVYLAFIFGNDYCCGMNQTEDVAYAGNNLTDAE